MTTPAVESRFSRRLWVGFGLTLIATLLISVLSIISLRLVIADKDRVTYQYAEDLIAAEKLRSLVERGTASARALMLSPDNPLYVKKLAELRTIFNEEFEQVKRRIETENEEPIDDRLLIEVGEKELVYRAGVDKAIRLARSSGVDRLKQYFEIELQRKKDDLDLAVERFGDLKRGEFEAGIAESARTSSRVLLLTALASALCLVLAAAFAILLGRQLNRLYSEARRAVALREEVLAVVSHDLKNPLHAIKIATELVRRENPSGAPKQLALIEQSALRMGLLIRDLLDLSRIEAGKITITPEATSVDDILTEALAASRLIAGERGIHLSSRLENPDALICCERERVVQVISNLLDNAIKFTPRGGEVTVEVREAGSMEIFAVRDTGVGIPADQLPHIFDRYHQARASDRRQGSGLGLYIARGIVQAHGGAIEAERLSSGGSLFRFTIPKAS